MVAAESRIQFITALTCPVLLLNLVAIDVISQCTQIHSDVSFALFLVISAVVNAFAKV